MELVIREGERSGAEGQHPAAYTMMFSPMREAGPSGMTRKTLGISNTEPGRPDPDGLIGMALGHPAVIHIKLQVESPAADQRCRASVYTSVATGMPDAFSDASFQ